MFNKKSMLLILILSMFMTNYLYAGCGKCSTDSVPSPKKSSSLVTVVSKSGDVEGLVLASCGMCNFGTREKECSLSIKIGDTIYPVKGTSIDDHGDSHSKEGFCLAVRVAYTSGKIKKGKFHADDFVLLESPE